MSYNIFQQNISNKLPQGYRHVDTMTLLEYFKYFTLSFPEVKPVMVLYQLLMNFTDFLDFSILISCVGPFFTNHMYAHLIHGMTLDLSRLRSERLNPIRRRHHWNTYLPSRGLILFFLEGADALPPRRSKTCPSHPLLHVLFFVPITRKSHSCFAVVRSICISSLALWIRCFMEISVYL